tara:strand:+ start:505 stop:1041 length:537 start_codon:yes stop_codon:yes gene_type:complete
MSSFQDAHKVANELAEVVITTDPIPTSAILTSGRNLAGAAGPVIFFNQPGIAGRRFRVLEMGYSVVRTGTNNTAQGEDSFSIGTTATASVGGSDTAFMGSSDIAATPTKGDSYSTSKGNSVTALSFAAAGTGNVDSDGVPFLAPGDLPSVLGIKNVTNGPMVVFYARLAPIISKDVFV